MNDVSGQENNLPEIVTGAPLAIKENRPLTCDEIIANVQAVAYVKKRLMKRGEHFGRLFESKKDIAERKESGCEYQKEDSLFKPGAEILGMAFRLAASYEIKAYRDADVVRYSVLCKINHIVTGLYLGSGVGACSSNEEKYKWREAVCQMEYDESPENRKRHKYKWKRIFSSDKALLAKYDESPDDMKRSSEFIAKSGKTYQNKEVLIKILQIRMEHEDIDNTILKMAKKRAYVDAIIQVTASGGLWTQDGEDMPDEIASELMRSRYETVTPPSKPDVDEPQPMQPPPNEPATADDKISEAQAKRLYAIAKDNAYSEQDIKQVLEKMYGLSSTKDIPWKKYKEIVGYFEKPNPATETEVRTPEQVDDDLPF